MAFNIRKTKDIDIADVLSRYNGTLQLIDAMFSACIFRHAYKLTEAIKQTNRYNGKVKNKLNIFNQSISRLKVIIKTLDKALIESLMKTFPPYITNYIREGGTVLTQYMYDCERSLDFNQLYTDIKQKTEGLRPEAILQELFMLKAVLRIASFFVQCIAKEAESCLGGTSLKIPHVFPDMEAQVNMIASLFGANVNIPIKPTIERIDDIILHRCIDEHGDKAFRTAIIDYYHFALASMIAEIRENKKLLPQTKKHLVLLMGQELADNLEADLRRTRISISSQDVFDIKDALHNMKQTQSIKTFMGFAPKAMETNS